MQQRKPNQEPPIDLVEQFYKENVDLKAILNSRKARKEVTAGLEPYTGEFGPAQKKHLLNRTMVGMAKRHMDDLDGLTLDEAIDLIFTPEELGEPVNNYFGELDGEAYKKIYRSDDVSPGSPFIDRPYAVNLNDGIFEQLAQERRRAIDTWISKSIYEQTTSIHWKLFIFLHNLTPTKVDMGGHKFLYNYIKLLFNSAFGNYKQHIYNLTLDPSMLNYLNLQLSKKETPDENYAREVQELFTVGKRPFSRFTEKDVRELARAIVGWNYDYGKIVFDEGHEPIINFDSSNHDTGDKYFSSFYGDKVIKGKPGDSGREELQEVIDMLFETDESFIYPCRRLYQFFVYPDVSDQVEENIIKPMARIMAENDFSLVEPLKTLLKSKHFFDSQQFNSLIKSPMEFVYGVHKDFDSFNGEMTTYIREENRNFYYSDGDRLDLFPEKFVNELSRSYYYFESINWGNSSQGMRLFSPPSVSGWPAYYQAPVYDLFWINSVTIKERKNTTEQATRWGFGIGDGVNIRFNLKTYLQTFTKPEDLNLLIEEMENRLLGSPMTDRAKKRLINSVLGEDSLNTNYWTSMVNEYLNNPSQDNRNNLSWRFEQLLFQFFELGEIHLF